MLILNANAQEATSAIATSGASSWIMIGVMLLIMWLFVIRPQAKRHQQHQALIGGLKRGDNVVTDSGIYGEITKLIDDNIVEVEIAQGTTVRLVRNAVSAVVVDEKPKAKKSAAKKPSTKTKKK